MVATSEKTVRINSRVFEHQHKFVKSEAKKQKKSEGELHREIIQFYIDNHKK